MLNLSLGQFLALLGPIVAFSVALYLLDRTRRKEMVATLRFWVVPGQPAPVTRRRRIQQPLSLLLQVLGMALLLLAIAEFQFGGRAGVRRDHVIVLDTSAWMAAQMPAAQLSNRASAKSPTTLMDIARADAIGWLRAVPSADRVMLIRADGLATPATGWESDHANVTKAIVESQPGATALNLTQSLAFATQLQRTSGAAGSSVPGEVVYIGPGRLTAREANNLVLPTVGSLRTISVNDDMPNIGLRSLGARRATDKDAWNVIARVHNYTGSPQSASVTLAFGKAPEGSQKVTIPAAGEQEVDFAVPTRAAGLLEARLYPKDNFLPDNYAALELPETRTARVIVYSSQPDRLRPALSSDPRVTAEYRPVAQFQPDAVPRGTVVILDHFRPSTLPQGSVLWIDPPAGNGSPVNQSFAIQKSVAHPQNIAWTPDQPVTASLRARDLQIDQASVFAPASGETALASIAEGPIAISSASADGKSHVVALGFDPFAPSLRYELTTPLLLANVLRWMEPGIFRDIDVGTASAGAVVSPAMGDNASGDGAKGNSDAVQVISESGSALPFNVRDKQIEFFSGNSSRVRVISGTTERVYSLTLPEMWDVKWTPPATARHGIPSMADSLRRGTELWPWLAAFGISLLLVEWYFFGRHAAAGVEIHRPRPQMAKPERQA